MRFTQLMSASIFLSLVVAVAVPLGRRDADFTSVRRKQTKDMSGKRGDPPGKYFHESIFSEHELGYSEQKTALRNLMQTFLATFNDLGVETWLMHGTLLGWWWNKRILPWDSDIDVQVSEASIFYLAAYYNMSVFHYQSPRIPDGRDYMLEVNPHYLNREQTDRLNKIDARWIDTESGLFIDITTARYNLTHPGGEGMMSCKDGHEFRDTYIFPLRNTVFEGVSAKIPYRYTYLLREEYGDKSLTDTEYNDHMFNEEKMEWIPTMKDMTLQKNN
ncbi:mannosylphosphorylation protein [Apodospora peruviana]|uniref:Mannosylphosphorylation protein n=1 Tax=Apodospora peruviana TaxID=516989 RepID=A0AAE0IR52_9PEZI|nr:mannosylphosphorylation protein [Apodospora peruviana]